MSRTPPPTYSAPKSASKSSVSTNTNPRTQRKEPVSSSRYAIFQETGQTVKYFNSEAEELTRKNQYAEVRRTETGKLIQSIGCETTRTPNYEILDDATQNIKTLLRVNKLQRCTIKEVQTENSRIENECIKLRAKSRNLVDGNSLLALKVETSVRSAAKANSIKIKKQTDQQTQISATASDQATITDHLITLCDGTVTNLNENKVNSNKNKENRKQVFGATDSRTVQFYNKPEPLNQLNLNRLRECRAHVTDLNRKLIASDDKIKGFVAHIEARDAEIERINKENDEKFKIMLAENTSTRNEFSKLAIKYDGLVNSCNMMLDSNKDLKAGLASKEKLIEELQTKLDLLQGSSAAKANFPSEENVASVWTPKEMARKKHRSAAVEEDSIEQALDELSLSVTEDEDESDCRSTLVSSNGFNSAKKERRTAEKVAAAERDRK